jgi:hypothetical protein
MTIHLETAAVENLVARFAALALEQYEAMEYNFAFAFEGEKIKAARKQQHVNRLYRELKAIEDELKRRTGDQRRVLVELLRHPNEHVRLKAATALLAVAPEAARRELERIAAPRIGPQAGAAGMLLASIDRGDFIPT